LVGLTDRFRESDLTAKGTLLPDGLETRMAANRRKADCGRGDEHVLLPAAGLG